MSSLKVTLERAKVVRAACDLAGPCHKIGSGSEIVEFFADDLAGFLEEILGILNVGDKGVDESQELALVAREKGDQLFAGFDLGEVL